MVAIRILDSLPRQSLESHLSCCQTVILFLTDRFGPWDLEFCRAAWHEGHSFEDVAEFYTEQVSIQK